MSLSTSLNDDNFDHREALEAAIDKKKFLLKRLFRNTWSPSDLTLNVVCV